MELLRVGIKAPKYATIVKEFKDELGDIVRLQEYLGKYFVTVNNYIVGFYLDNENNLSHTNSLWFYNSFLTNIDVTTVSAIIEQATEYYNHVVMVHNHGELA